MNTSSNPHSNLATSPEQPSDTQQATQESSISSSQDAKRRQPAAATSSAAELARGKVELYKAVRHFPDFPIKGVNFVDIMPWFLDPRIHTLLLQSLELQVQHSFGTTIPTTTRPSSKIDVVVGLDARGFLFGPSLALRLGASFVPVRKKGKLPGSCITAAYEKEYGTDYFEMQDGSIERGQNVLVVDDIIATGGSAAAAGNLVRQLGGTLLGYLFIVEIAFLQGRHKLGQVPIATLLEENE